VRSSEGSVMDRSRKLYRSQTNRVLAGVCGGLADYFGVDVTVIRVLFIAFAFIGGASLPIYLAMWIVVPRQPA
jgi:phage shock protein C